MKNRWIAFLTLLVGAISIASCVDPDQTQEVILERDKEAIAKYLLENPISSVKEYSEPIEGFYMFWQVSTDPKINNLLRGDTVTVDYAGKLLSNKYFDTSKEQFAKDQGIYNSTRNYTPLKYPLGYGLTISGFEFAVSLMREGEKATVIFPSRLGYGSQPQGPVPSNSPLIFELELKNVKLGVNHLNP
ncbi:FKBP-type peptidyl-prolyl cis-trans isomerase FklB [Algoriphagus boseongensis]|uniref:Peptidyl-prolyl cis-trans isomerase n=1 Tax=Algoriphagus boseongensis TaxID=1442587 RepID=A0A4R6T3X5_9BACT|nr:FKBP-type peptidyl-prolyl cis-trans isomerase [Algoriphagus boseongensis]TDQ12929.1 FKBP-type peptidyl-prolyl cis-trans isomerase FklB [Algoriphagus boseongensis]